MTQISSVDPGLPSLESVLSGNKPALGKDDFLQLLVAQLQNQDPLNPSDPTEFTAQLAQFSSLEQLFEVNENLTGLASANAGMERMTAIGMIGKEVVVAGSAFSVGQGDVSLGYRLDQTARSVALQVTNDKGQIVAQLPGSEVGPGNHFLSWDGLGLNGQPLPTGHYSLSVLAEGTGDEAPGTAALVRSSVTGVGLEGDGNRLMTGAGDFFLADVQSVEDR